MRGNDSIGREMLKLVACAELFGEEGFANGGRPGQNNAQRHEIAGACVLGNNIRESFKKTGRRDPMELKLLDQARLEAQVEQKAVKVSLGQAREDQPSSFGHSVRGPWTQRRAQSARELA